MNKILTGQVVEVNRISEDYLLGEILTRALADIINDNIEFKDFHRAVTWFRSESVKEFSYKHVMSRLYFTPPQLKKITDAIKAGEERYNRMLDEKQERKTKEAEKES